MAQIPVDLVPVFVGLVAGFLGSLLGVGGGSVITPVLVALGYDIKTVVPASLLSIVGTSLGGLDVYHREGLVDYRVGLRLEATAVVGSMIGVHIALSASERALRLALATVLVYISLSTLRKAAAQAPSREAPMPLDRARREALGAAAGVLKGLVSALVGIGGGVIGVPILHRIIGLPIKKAIATSKMLVGMTAAAGVLGYALRGALDPCLGLSLSLGTIAGGIAGSLVGVRLSNRAALVLFSVFLIVMSIVITSRAG